MMNKDKHLMVLFSQWQMKEQSVMFQQTVMHITSSELEMKIARKDNRRNRR